MNNYTMSDIFARLQNGENPDVIASEMADALNDAIDMHNREQAAYEEAMVDALECAAECINDYISAKYPEYAEELELEGRHIAQLVEAVVEVMPLLTLLGGELADAILDACEAEEEEDECECECECDCCCEQEDVPEEDILHRFLKEMGLM